MKSLVIILLLVIAILVGGLSYLAGRTGLVNLSFGPSASASPGPASSPLASGPTQKPTKVVMGGGVLSFPKYTIMVPVDWTESKEIPGPDSEKITVQKGEYLISITEGGFGGAVCLYPGDPDSEGPSARYTSFVEINSLAGDALRRSWTNTGPGFGICQKTQYGWGAPTAYGHINFKVPTGYSAQMVEEMDAILASFTRR